MDIKLTGEAKDDFRNMFEYYYGETQDAEYTLTIVRDIRSRLDMLKIFPMRYPAIIPDDETIRVMYYKRYAVLYQITEDAVIILSVKHGRMLSQN